MRASVYPWIIVAIWVLCGIGALVTYLKMSTTKYVLTTERLRVTTGMLSTVTQDLELRRVRDSRHPPAVLGAHRRARRRPDPERRREHAADGAARDQESGRRAGEDPLDRADAVVAVQRQADGARLTAATAATAAARRSSQPPRIVT